MKKLFAFVLIAAALTACGGGGKSGSKGGNKANTPISVAQCYLEATLNHDLEKMEEYGAENTDMAINLLTVQRTLSQIGELSAAEIKKFKESVKYSFEEKKCEISEDGNSAEVILFLTAEYEGESMSDALPLSLIKDEKGKWKVSYCDLD